mgnify:CR=1 FL=1
MIISKMIVNMIASRLVKHFKLDKIMSYVFEDNELDKELKKVKREVKELKKKLNKLINN